MHAFVKSFHECFYTSTIQAVKRAASRTFSTYPAYIVNAPLTEVSKTKNGVRVASEVFFNIFVCATFIVYPFGLMILILLFMLHLLFIVSRRPLEKLPQ